MAPVACSSEEDAAAVLWLHGEHDAASAPKLRVTVDRLVGSGEADVIIDLRNVTFMDASIVGVFVAAARQLAPQGRALVLRCPSARARRVLDICGLQRWIQPMAVAVAGETLTTWLPITVLPRGAPSQERVADEVGGEAAIAREAASP